VRSLQTFGSWALRPLRRLRSLRPRPPRTLRARLTIGLVVLLAVIFAGVGFATTRLLGHFLLDRLDQQLAQAGPRYAASLERGEGLDQGLGPPPGAAAGARTDNVTADTRAQSPGTFGARLLNGVVTTAGVVDGDADDHPGANGQPLGTDDRVNLTAEDRAALAALPDNGTRRTLKLSGLGGYRLQAVRGNDGDVLITGLPLGHVEDTVRQLAEAELALFALAMAVAAIAGAAWVRLSLRPLDRVTRTAERVSALSLASGEVALSVRVPDDDPATEVGRVGASLNRMLGHVEDALAQRHAVEGRLRAFAADAGHELRTPVATIRGHAELALRRHAATGHVPAGRASGSAAPDGAGTTAPEAPSGDTDHSADPGTDHIPGPVTTDPLPDDIRHALTRIEAESHRMSAIVGDLLLLARLDAGRPLERDEVDLTRLALDAVDGARAAAPGHRWRLDLPEEPAVVPGDEHRLAQAVANLVTNARVHTPGGTEVTVAIEESDAETRLTVTDTGPGLDPDFADRAFERFARGDRARSRTSGSTGLGLAITRAIAEAHGGRVEVATRPGHTTFTLTLKR
jgi:two-component system OmpR family sensor kinase